MNWISIYAEVQLAEKKKTAQSMDGKNYYYWTAETALCLALLSADLPIRTSCADKFLFIDSV